MADLQLLAKTEEIPSGTILNKPMDRIEHIIVVLEGELCIEAQNKQYSKYCLGEILNEIYYLKPMPAIYQTRAVKTSTIAKIHFSDLDKLIASDPAIGARIHAALNDSLCIKIIRHTHLEQH